MGDKLCDLRLIEEDDTDLIILLVLWFGGPEGYFSVFRIGATKGWRH